MKQNIAFGITLIRGMLAVVLGLVLFFQPDKTRPILGNFIGMFWLVSGIISLRWGATGERARDSALLAGVIGLLAGLAMLTRGLTSAYIAREFIFSLIGGVMALTGILHAFGGFWVGEGRHRKLTPTSILLGIFEIILVRCWSSSRWDAARSFTWQPAPGYWSAVLS